jgi:hypothetical protein
VSDTPVVGKIEPLRAAAPQTSIVSQVRSKLKIAPMDDSPFVEYFHCMVYGYTNSYKTTTAAMFGGPERTLIISTRDPEQIRIPLRGKGFKPIVLAHDPSSFYSCLENPNKAADAVGFPEWKDREDRVLMVDDWTEGASMLVDDNQTTDEGKEIKDGRRVYGEVKKDMRDLLNRLKSYRMHLVFTALAAETDWNIYPDMPKSVRNQIEAAFDYVFYMDSEFKKMKTKDGFSVPYPTKDQFGKDVTRLRKGFAKYKVPVDMVGKLVKDDEPMDLQAFWQRIVAARGK